MRYTGRDINYSGVEKNWRKINSFHKLHEFKFISEYSKRKKNFTPCKKIDY